MNAVETVGDLRAEDLRISAGGTALVRGVTCARGRGGRCRRAGAAAAALEARGRHVAAGAVAVADPLRRANVHFEEVHRLVRGLDRSAAGAATMEDLAGLGLTGAGSRYRFQISGGLTQRLAIAATRATEAPVLLADEPIKGLDVALRATVAGLLLDHAAAGGVLLTITHDIGLVRRLGGDLAVMLDGIVVGQEPVAEVLDAPARLHGAAVGGRARGVARAGGVPGGASVVRARDISVALGGRAVLSGFSAEIRLANGWW